MNGTLNDSVVVVTGGGQGIGEATCMLAAREGARVVVCDISEETARAVAARINTANGEALAVAVDASSRDGARRLVDETGEAFGRLDGLVCAGMRRVYGSAEDFSDEDWQMVMEQGLTGYFRCAQEAGRRMLAQGSGSIVFVTSTAARRAVTGGVAYVSVKSGVTGLARQLGVEWALRGVRTNSVAPGFTNTQGALRRPTAAELQAVIPRGQVARSDDVAEVCVFLLSDRAQHVTGTEVVVDGGTTAGSVWIG
jgi:NAD(P)-dependent dehydrogenase (short-subunit alcohol dehydrogenase family)